MNVERLNHGVRTRTTDESFELMLEAVLITMSGAEENEKREAIIRALRYAKDVNGAPLRVQETAYRHHQPMLDAHPDLLINASALLSVAANSKRKPPRP